MSDRPLPKHFEVAKQLTTLAGRHAALSGWAKNTLKGYSSGMLKFIEFKEKTAGGFDEEQPVSDQDIYQFISWAGETKVDKENGPEKTILSITIKKYLDGIRAWHIVKHTARPIVDQEVVSVLLRATKRNKEEKELVTNKQPVMIQQLYKLFRDTYGKSKELEMVGAVALIAFWGMARLGELLRNSQVEGAILRRNVEFGDKGSLRFVRLHLSKAKTAKAGEVQVIHLQQRYNVLDPVAAVERVLLANKGGDRDDLLFAIKEGGRVKPMLKLRFVKLTEESWGKASLGTWSGHSFRVGEALIRYNLGTSMNKIARQGRWKSLAYLRYLKAYLRDETDDTVEFLGRLDERMTA